MDADPGYRHWLLLYVIYAASVPRRILFVAQVLHGSAYVMFMIVGQSMRNDCARGYRRFRCKA